MAIITDKSQNQEEHLMQQPSLTRPLTSMLLIAAMLGLSTACSPSRSAPSAHSTSPTLTPVPSPAVTPRPIQPELTSTTVRGHVRYADSGAPYPGVTVLFRNVYGRQLHTDTDKNGYYVLTLPEGTYTPFAVDNQTVVNAAFSLLDSNDSVISVPPSAQVDFLATPTRQKYGG